MGDVNVSITGISISNGRELSLSLVVEIPPSPKRRAKRYGRQANHLSFATEVSLKVYDMALLIRFPNA